MVFEFNFLNAVFFKIMEANVPQGMAVCFQLSFMG